MFTSAQFTWSLTQLFGSRDQRDAQMREALQGSLEFVFFHAVGHGNQTPLVQLGQATAKGGNLKKALREQLAGASLPRYEIPKDKKEREEFLKGVVVDAETWAKDQAEATYARLEVLKEAAAETREANKEQKELAERLLREKAEAELKLKMVLSGPFGAVELTAEEYEEVRRVVMAMRAKDVTPATPTLKVA